MKAQKFVGALVLAGMTLGLGTNAVLAAPAGGTTTGDATTEITITNATDPEYKDKLTLAEVPEFFEFGSFDLDDAALGSALTITSDPAADKTADDAGIKGDLQVWDYIEDRTGDTGWAVQATYATPHSMVKSMKLTVAGDTTAAVTSAGQVTLGATAANLVNRASSTSQAKVVLDNLKAELELNKTLVTGDHIQLGDITFDLVAAP